MRKGFHYGKPLTFFKNNENMNLTAEIANITSRE